MRYLEKYAEVHELEIVTGVEVSRIERSADGTGWLLHATGGRELTGRAVVVATGTNHTPRIPDWPGRDTYTGDLVHAADYRNAQPYAGRDVLVVGIGNTGAEIAVDLVEGGASRVRLAVRTAPAHPAPLDRGLGGPVHRRSRTTAAGRPGRPARGAGGQVQRAGPGGARAAAPRHRAVQPGQGGSIPVQDVGLIDAVRKGRVEVVTAVESFEDGKVVLAGGDRIGPDAVVAATGYVRSLERLVGHLGVLDARGKPVVHGADTPKDAPGLYFTGFTNPISGMFREMAIDAEKIAKALAKETRKEARRAAKREAKEASKSARKGVPAAS